jgi:hypothetical protein
MRCRGKGRVMKYLKALGLAAVSAVVLAAILGAGTASASKLCSTAIEPCTPGQHWPSGTEIDFSLVEKGSALLATTENEPINTCSKSTVKGKTSTTGSSIETVAGNLTSLIWEGCNFTTTTNKLGGLEIHNIAGTFNGTLTAVGITEVTINAIPFGSCVYGSTNGVSMGDLTEGIGSTAIFHTNAIAHKLKGSNIACPETAKWTATYRLTSPSTTTLAVTKG